MPTGIYKRTEKHYAQIRAMTEAQRGKPRSEETKRKIGESNRVALKGNIPWNKGKKCPQLSGREHGMYGKTHTKEVRERLSMHGKQRTGNKSHFWKGGITTKTRLVRGSADYQAWRKEVFERDNYTCQKCGARSGKGGGVVLNADHIVPFSFMPEMATELLNGRTLCEKCHRETATFAWRAKYLAELLEIK